MREDETEADVHAAFRACMMKQLLCLALAELLLSEASLACMPHSALLHSVCPVWLEAHASQGTTFKMKLHFDPSTVPGM